MRKKRKSGLPVEQELCQGFFREKHCATRDLFPHHAALRTKLCARIYIIALYWCDRDLARARCKIVLTFQSHTAFDAECTLRQHEQISHSKDLHDHHGNPSESRASARGSWACPTAARSRRPRRTRCGATRRAHKLVDVRTRAEWDYVGRIPGAVEIELLTYPGNRPNPAFVAELESKVDKAAPVLFICRSGGRSHNAAMLATQAGYADGLQRARRLRRRPGRAGSPQYHRRVARGGTAVDAKLEDEMRNEE